MASTRDIDVLLATYNGAEFLEKQLDSLFSQTCQDFSITVGDDRSVDGTVEVLASYARRYPGRFTYAINSKRLGATANFATLLSRSTAPYVMCCDQDDVWLPEKIARTIAAIKTAEARHGRQRPVLAYSDAVLVDAKLKTISSSFWRTCRVRPRGAQLRNLIVQNVVTGCTMGCNRSLLDKALPIPSEKVVMHDYWLALVAAAFGLLIPLEQATMLYRQHGKNKFGVAPDRTLLQSLRHPIRDARLKAAMLDAMRQAGAFSDRFANELTRKQKAELTAFQMLFQRGYVRRRWVILRHRLLLPGVWNNIGYLMRI